MVVSKASKLIFFSAVFAVGVSSEDEKILVRLPRQSHGKNTQHDQNSAETGFLGGGGVENSKFFQEIYIHRPDPKAIEFGHVYENPHEWEQRFEKKDFNKNRHQGKGMTNIKKLIIPRSGATSKPRFHQYLEKSRKLYQHLPEHDKYEFGHRRGNDHHVIERYEKAIPHDGQFKTKVRWADKKGGHGEHYWDYNHAGHGGNGGHGDRDGGYSDPVPAYSNQKSGKQLNKRQSDKKITLDDIESSQQPQPSTYKAESEDKIEFVKNLEEEISQTENVDIQKEAGKQKRTPEQEESLPIIEDSHLFFDLKTGKVVDELTGKKYILQPIN